MASSRSVIQLGSRTTKAPYKRMGKATAEDKALVTHVVGTMGGDLAPAQINALATTMKRSPAVIKALVEEARGKFVARAGDYVDIHFNATKQAAANGDAKSLGVAVKASEWAIANINSDGTRVVDKANTEPQGQKIFIGIKMGNMDQKPTVEVTEVVDAS